MRAKHFLVSVLSVPLAATFFLMVVGPVHAQTAPGGFPRGGTTFTPSGNGVRWPVTLVPTPGRPLGVSNLMLLPTPGIPPRANLGLPTSTIQGTNPPSPGINLGGFGSLLGGPQDQNDLLGNPMVGGVVGEPVSALPYSQPISGTMEALPSVPTVEQGALPYGAEAAPSTGPVTAPLEATLGGPAIGIASSVSPAARSVTSPLAYFTGNESQEAGGLRAEVRAILNRSSRLDSAKTIQVATDQNGALVLRGIVKDNHERRLAEAIARLTTGVHDLRNELAVVAEAAGR